MAKSAAAHIRHTSVFVEILAWRENRSIAAKLEALLLADMPLDYVTSQINAVTRERRALSPTAAMWPLISWTPTISSGMPW